jgi:hypothetical protein
MNTQTRPPKKLTNGIFAIDTVKSSEWNLHRWGALPLHCELEDFGIVEAVLHWFLLRCIGDGRLRGRVLRSNQRFEIETEQCPNWKGVLQSIGAWFREALAIRPRVGTGRGSGRFGAVIEGVASGVTVLCLPAANPGFER